MLAGVLDYALHLPMLARTVLLAGLALFAARALWEWVLGPLLRKIPLDALAARVDAIHPEYQDRVRSALRFLGERETGASDSMQQQVVQQAAQTLQQAPLSEVLDRDPLWRAAKWAIGATIIAAALIVWQPSLCRIGALRLLAPASSVVWPRSVELVLAQQLPRRVPIGQRVDFTVLLAKGDRPSRQVVLSWRIGNAPVQRQLMQRDAQGHYTAGVDARPAGSSAAAASFGAMQSWIESGDDELTLPPIELIPRLAVVDARLLITPPAYTSLSADEVPFKGDQATVWAGSKLVATFIFNKPVSAEAPLSLETVGSEKELAAPSPTWDKGDHLKVTATWNADASTRFRLRGRDESGFENAATEEFAITVRPDQAPAIQIEEPRRSEDRTAGATVPLIGAADDDLAVQTVTLRASLVQAQGAATQPVSAKPDSAAQSLLLVNEKGAVVPAATWTSQAATADRKHYSLGYLWQLQQFPVTALKPGDVIEYYLEATDSFRMGEAVHAPASSQKLRITIITEQDLLERVSGDLRNLAAQIAEARRIQDRLLADSEQLAADTHNKPTLEPADRQVADRISDQQLRLASQAGEIAGRLADINKRLQENNANQPQIKDAAAAARKALEESASPMRDAARQLKDAASSSAAAREENLRKGQQSGKEAADALKKAADSLGDFGGLQQMLDRVRDLLDEQRHVSAESAEAGRKTVGKTPDQLNPEQRKDLDNAARKQEQLSQRANDTIDALKSMADRMQQSDPAAAKAMRDAAAAGQAQSVSQHQKAAAGAIRENQQSQAQSSQRSAELGLEMMLAGLRDAERRKLEELARKLAQLREQVEVLRRRQASHNLDSLLIQDADRTRGSATTQPVKNLLELSQRPTDSLKDAPELRQLTASQQQTHLNTADLAASTSSIRGADEVAAILNKAAGRMERAMVLLRGEKVPDAYNPPQVEALAHLEAAFRKVEELRRKNEDQARKQQQEEVRKVLMDIRKDQAEVATDTQRLDKLLQAEQKRRADLLKLAQTATQQGQLSQRMTKAQADLSSLGSVVFVSVAQDARADMDAAQHELAQGSAGAPVQQKHLRILTRLDAMIRALKQDEPKPERFAERSSSGGGGGSGSSPRRLPPGAEIKLLRELQGMLNAETRIADAAHASAQPLNELGDRQKAIRGMLDEMLKKASGGKLSLGEEKSDIKLPEEDDQLADELDQELLTGKADSEGDPQPVLDSLSQRMTRSRQRLADSHDPGKVTQKIQEKILKALDELASKSQQQQQSQSSSQGESAGTPKPGGGADGEGTNQSSGRGSEAAKESKVSPGATPPDNPGGDIRQTAKEWGGLSARDRQAVIDSAGEDVVEKYRSLVEDYYRSLSERATSERR